MERSRRCDEMEGATVNKCRRGEKDFTKKYSAVRRKKKMKITDGSIDGYIANRN